MFKVKALHDFVTTNGVMFFTGDIITLCSEETLNMWIARGHVERVRDKKKTKE